MLRQEMPNQREHPQPAGIHVSPSKRNRNNATMIARESHRGREAYRDTGRAQQPQRGASITRRCLDPQIGALHNFCGVEDSHSNVNKIEFTESSFGENSREDA